jgi:hypothetical protein
MNEEQYKLCQDANDAGHQCICGLPDSWDLTRMLADLAEHPLYLETLNFMDIAILGGQVEGLSDDETLNSSVEQFEQLEKIGLRILSLAGQAVLCGAIHALLLGIEFPSKGSIPHPWTAEEEASMSTINPELFEH